MKATIRYINCVISFPARQLLYVGLVMNTDRMVSVNMHILCVFTFVDLLDQAEY